MNRKIIFISIGVLLLLAGLFFWHNARKAAQKRAVVTKHAVAVRKAEKKKMPPVIPSSAPKKFAHPRVAIVIDDFGYNMNNMDILLAISQPLTISVLPNLRYSDEISQLASARGIEIMLHLPLEATRDDVREEAGTIRTDMKADEVGAKLNNEITSVPGLKGVSNHMGSRATEDKTLMCTIFRRLKSDRLYFFDSLTSRKSVCREAASSIGIPYARRDIFLDNVDDVEAIEKQFFVLSRFAFRKGRAIAVCHDRKKTMAVLAKMMPKMARDGIVFVHLSELVK